MRFILSALWSPLFVCLSFVKPPPASKSCRCWLRPLQHSEADSRSDNGGKISFWQKKNHEAKGALKWAELVKAVALGNKTNDVNLFLLLGDVYNFQACIYPKNSLLSTLSPNCPDISDKLWTDSASCLLNYKRDQSLSCNNLLYLTKQKKIGSTLSRVGVY